MNLPISLRRAACSLAAAGGLWAAAAGATTAHAAVVQAQFNPLGGNAWAAALSVGATGAQVIESFTIYLDAALAQNLAVQASPAHWDVLVVQADPALAADAFVDALLMGPDGITAASPLAGFEISFDWLGAVAPAGLRFTVNDANTFAALEAGFTVPFGAASVPEPATWGLVALALALGVMRLRLRGAKQDQIRA